MEQLILVRPSIEYNNEIMTFRKELQEAKDEDSFARYGSLKNVKQVRNGFLPLQRWKTRTPVQREKSHPVYTWLSGFLTIKPLAL